MLIDTKMTFIKAKIDCSAKCLKIDRLISEDNPDDFEPSAAAKEMEKIFERLTTAMDDLTISSLTLTEVYVHELGTQGKTEYIFISDQNMFLDCVSDVLLLH